MLPSDHGCSPKTPFPGRLVDYDKERNWQCEDIEVDFKGEDLTQENFVDVLRDRTDPGYTFAKRIQTTNQSRIFMYLNGHGVDSTIKLQ